MSTFRNPVGPQAPQVYWRRRLLLGLGAVAVIVIVILIIVRPGSGAPGSAGTATPKPTTAATANPGAACSPSNLQLTAVTDKGSYAAAELPQISMTLKNIGSTACTVNLGSTMQDLTITSGSEKIWDSKDCQTGAVDSPQVLKAAESITTPVIPWDRTRSSTSTCGSTTRPQVTAGGASYHLAVAVGDLKSKETVQFLLN
jgi:hypothetical protein